MRQKPVQNGNKKSLKNQGFRGSELSASITGVFGGRCDILLYGDLADQSIYSLSAILKRLKQVKARGSVYNEL